jgi:hypothetical protein
MAAEAPNTTGLGTPVSSATRFQPAAVLVYKYTGLAGAWRMATAAKMPPKSLFPVMVSEPLRA